MAEVSDLTADQLRKLAEDSGVEDVSRMAKGQLVTALAAVGVTEVPDPVADDAVGEVSGFQTGLEYPRVPQTREEFRQLLDNPDKPAENQSAPPMDQLNPHLFPTRLP